MSEEVQFDEDSFGYGKPRAPGMPDAERPGPNTGQSGITGWLLRKGIVKSETAAEIVMGVVIVIDVIIVYLIVKFFL